MSDSRPVEENLSPSTPDITDPKQLTTIYKKNGSFDKQRKLLLENFKKSETHSNLLLKLKLMVESKIKQDPSILMKNKGKMGALIQGEIINQHLNNKGESSLLSIVDKDIQDKIIDSPEFHKVLKDELKDIRRVLLGISDEEYEKQLKEEREEELKQQQRREEAMKSQQTEKDYKNNFKIKQLNSSHKITKAPRFNFSLNRSTERNVRDNFKNNNINNGTDANSAINNSNETNSNNNNGKQAKDIPFLMY